jgi:hypothetical protein
MEKEKGGNGERGEEKNGRGLEKRSEIEKKKRKEEGGEIK